MSAPSPNVAPTMPTMVSRLPKFGFRAKTAPPVNGAHTPTANGRSGRLANGFYHQPGPLALGGSYTLLSPTTTNAASSKKNEFIKEPISVSMNWKPAGETLEREKEQSGGKHGHQQPQGALAALPGQGKKLTVTPAARGRGFTLISLPSPPQQSDRRASPVTKTGSHAAKSGQSAPALPNGRKATHTGVKPWSGSSGFLKRPQSFTRLSSPGSGPGSRSGSPHSRKPPASRCHSSEVFSSTPSVQAAESDRFRSQSFTQNQRHASPSPNTSSTPPSFLRRPAQRTYSFNRREVKNAVPRGTPAKPTGSGRPSDTGSKRLKPQSSAPLTRTAGAVPSPSPLSSLKKPLLPTFSVTSKHGGISYKLSRPSLNKQSRLLRVTMTNEQHPDQPEQSSATKHSQGLSYTLNIHACIAEGLCMSHHNICVCV